MLRSVSMGQFAPSYSSKFVESDSNPEEKLLLKIWISDGGECKERLAGSKRLCW